MMYNSANHPTMQFLLQLLCDGLRSVLDQFQKFTSELIANLHKRVWPDDENWEKTIEDSATKSKIEYGFIIDNLTAAVNWKPSSG